MVVTETMVATVAKVTATVTSTATTAATEKGNSSDGEGCNDGDSDGKGCNDMDGNGNDDATDYNDGNGGYYYECGLGGVMRY